MRRTWTDSQLIEAVKSSYSIASVIRKLGLIPAGGNYKSIKSAIKNNNLNVKHFTGQGHLKNKKCSWTKITPLSEILVENSSYTNSCKLKNRLLKENKLSYYCSKCKLFEWLNNPISLELDHINGNSSDNRLQNLRLLCPNCHSQTDTFRRKK